MQAPDFSDSFPFIRREEGQALLEFAKTIRPIAGIGITTNELDGGGTAINATKRPIEGGAGGSAKSPFQVLTRDNNGSDQAGVVYESRLYKSLRPNDKQSIVGLLDEDGVTGWFDVADGSLIWLEVVFTNTGAITSANIRHTDGSDDFDVTQEAWSGANGYCEDDGAEESPVHEISRKLIAYYKTPTGGTSPVMAQVMSHDQLLRNVCIDGRPARYPFDHEGGYPG